MTELHDAACARCGKLMQVCEELAGCILYCETCPHHNDPCEVCGLEDPPNDHDCCDCVYCVQRRAALSSPPPASPAPGDVPAT